MQFCTFIINNIYFGIDVLRVQEIINLTDITPIPLVPKDILGLINLRGQIVTVIDIQVRLQLKIYEQKNINSQINKISYLDNFANLENKYNVILNYDSELVSLIIDEIGDVIEVAESEFEPPPATLKGKIRQVLEGAYKLQDKFLLILNVDKLLQT